ncbi:hypothetical protein Nepgr_027396 [Nepenthes gracilis]|uniref:SBP-type domain-containing protein n=1 Tax=Nepenthes gracilis TaxID=150966 RepID=A0AAD3TAB7_NEPGR|nr:hypothetical protein Nepgr_027396 [Nepenthes gracilis]
MESRKSDGKRVIGERRAVRKERAKAEEYGSDGTEGEENGCGGGEMGIGADDEKKKRVSDGGGRKATAAAGASPPSCQGENCTADLNESKRYHRRHKVCEFHAKAPVVVVAGLRQRFCQQCSRFHELHEFDDAKRSCRRRLAGHNERRRKSSSEPHGEGSSSRKDGNLQVEEDQCRPANERSHAQMEGNASYKHYQIR